jgi:tRNA-splicing ligase RtcB
MQVITGGRVPVYSWAPDLEDGAAAQAINCADLPVAYHRGTYLGRGLGNPDAFESCSHGAGRIRSRGRARAELSLSKELAAIKAAGGKVFAASKDDVLDEMPGAYKDLDEVMVNQADRVEPVRRFTPLGTYKGVDRPRRRRRKSKGDGAWRPEEER